MQNVLALCVRAVYNAFRLILNNTEETIMVEIADLLLMKLNTYLQEKA